MNKTLFQKLICIVLATLLIFGICPVQHTHAETVASESVKLSIRDGRQTGYFPGTGIYLQSMNDTAPADSSYIWYTPVDDEGGVYYHDTPIKVSLGKYKHDSTTGLGSWFLDIGKDNKAFRSLVPGEEVTIRGKFQTPDAYVVEFEPVTFRYEGGTTWSEIYKPDEDIEQITWTDFGVTEGTFGNGSTVSNTYSGSLLGKRFRVKMTLTGTSGNAMIYYGSSKQNYWNGYRVLINSNGELEVLFFFDDSNVTRLISGKSLKNYGVDTTGQMVLDLYLQQVDKDGDETPDGNLILAINGILISDSLYIEDAFSLCGNSMLLYGGKGKAITVCDADLVTPVEQITLSDFGIRDGMMENDQRGTCTSAIAGKRFVVDVRNIWGSSGNALMYFGGASASKHGYMLGFRCDGNLVIYDYCNSNSMCSGQSVIYLPGLGIKSGDTFRLELLLTYVGEDAHLEVKVNNKVLDGSVNVIPNGKSKMGDTLLFYPGAGDGNKLEVFSVASHRSEPQLSLDDFGIADGTYSNEQGLISSTPTCALSGKHFRAEVTPHTADNAGWTLLYFAGTKQHAERSGGISVGFRGDGTLILQNWTSVVSKKGIKHEGLLAYPSFTSLGLRMDEPFLLDCFYEYVDEDGDGKKDDVHLVVKVGSIQVLEDWFCDAALDFGNYISIYAQVNNTITVNRVLAEGEVENPFRFSAVNEHSAFDDSGNAVIELEATIGIPGTADVPGYEGIAVYTGGSAVLGDSTLEISMTKTDRGNLRLTIPADKLPELPCTLTLPAAELIRNDGEVTLNSTTDYTVYLNQYGISGDSYITCAGENISLQYYINSEDGIYFTADDAMPVAGWTTNIYAVSDATSGFFLNGERHPEVFIRKYENGAYYLPLKDVGLTPEAGDVAIISGKWQLDNVFVDFAPFALTWDGNSWMYGVRGVILPGDVYPVCISRDITDTGFCLDGQNVIVDGKSKATGAVLYLPGDYQISYMIKSHDTTGMGNIMVDQTVAAYRPGDVNCDNRYDLSDIIDLLLTQDSTGPYLSYSGSVSGWMAAQSITADELCQVLLGKTKADDALPEQMIGQTSAGSYITNVQATANGTTVISVADSNSGYTTTGNFDDYGFDYVIDSSESRGFKVLQLTDPQIIDSTQTRYDGRIDDYSYNIWKPDQIEQRLLKYVRSAIEQAKPDLILLTGDLVYGEFDDNGSCFEALVDMMESYKIPWAPVYGNHDSESRRGVQWQNEMLENATYCLFNTRHELVGNGNYTIALAHNGELERVIYMMDSNGVDVPWYFADKYKDTDEARQTDQNAVKTTQGFSMAQKRWYRNMALKTNYIAGRQIPSFLAYHIASEEYLLAAKAACYQSGQDSSDLKYTIGVNNTAQPGDSGYKGNRHITRSESHLLEFMHEVGTDGSFVGHQHEISTSIYYDGIRWTYGLKTGEYCDFPSEMGGTLITLSSDSSEFTVTQIIAK